MWRRSGVLALTAALWLGIAAGLFAVGHLGGRLVAESFPAAASKPQLVNQAPTAEKTATPGTLPKGVDAERPGTLFRAVAAARSEWAVGPPVAALALIFLLVGIEQIRRRRSAVVRDTPEFAAALEAWTPLVFTREPTPRGVKRFLNRVRYFAMRLKHSHTLGSEANLVALAALHHCFAGKLDEHVIEDLGLGVYEGTLSSEQQAVAEAAIQAATSLGRWPPSGEEIMQFRYWASGITVR